MIRIVRELPADGLHDGVGFTANGNSPSQVCVRHGSSAAETSSSRLPTSVATLGEYQAVVQLTIALRSGFSPSLVKMGRAGSHIAAMCSPRSQSNPFFIQRGKKLSIGNLIHSSLREFFVIAKELERVLQVGSSKFQRHPFIVFEITHP